MNIIRELRKQKGLSQKELADACCVHQTAVSQWEKGRTAPDINSLKMLSAILGVSVETLIGCEKPKDENKIQGFDRINAEDASQKLGRSEYFALIVTDDSMSPTMQIGDTVIISRSKEIINGDIAAVAIGDSDVTMKRIIKKDTSMMLVPENPAYEPSVFTYSEIATLPVTILGRIIELRRKF
ncbi:MAG: helix-turn-helix domain-containing protein [Clostridia bacterium]|nr:helix-turn-helix domain-containing protein [Clostridia bacterium]